jgi:hypothetical protein
VFLSSEPRKILAYAEPVDLRKSIIGLVALVQSVLQEDSLELRAERCKPIVDEFFEWLKTTLETRVLLPSNPFTEAAGYALAREKQLKVFLGYPEVPIDTNHLEREIRPIALGRKNWLFCWTEIGAKYVGIVNRTPDFPPIRKLIFPPSVESRSSILRSWFPVFLFERDVVEPVEPVGGASLAPSKDRWETRRWRFPRIRQDPQALGLKAASLAASGSTIRLQSCLGHGAVRAVVGSGD